MHLTTLGSLSLGTFKERVPLLVLCYVSLEGKVLRKRLADLIWVHQEDPEKRLRNLAEALYRLKKEDERLLELKGEWLTTPIKTDAQMFEDASDSGQALELYKGQFLADIGRTKRLLLGEELAEWVFNRREQLHTKAIHLRLERAESLSFQGEFAKGAEEAWQIYNSSTGVAYPSARTFRRVHTLLLAGEREKEIAALEQEALEVYDQGSLSFLEHPHKARALLTHSYNLQPEHSDLIGRSDAVKTLLIMLSSPSTRLINIYGPPGIGKTSLAEVLARMVRGQSFAKDGIHMAYLETLSHKVDTKSLINTIAQALSFKLEYESINIERITDMIGDKSLLLVLDNVEHVIREATRIIKTLHDHCPNLRLVVTSRQLLKLAAETVFQLKPLTFPEVNELLTLESARSYSALELFEKTAQKQDFTLSNDSLPAAQKICALVEGLPLAIKLSAAWVNTLTPQQIVERLEANLDILSHGANDTERHKSLRATFTHSVNLLPTPELESLTRLGVFENGFTAEAAWQVAQTDIFTLRALIEKSLLRFHQDTNRYDFHPLIGKFVKELFEKSETKAKQQTVHAKFYFALLDGLFDEESNEESVLLRQLKMELRNVDFAWRYATGNEWFEQLFKSAKSLQRFGDLATHYTFADTLLSYSLKALTSMPTATKTALTCNLSAIKYHKGDYERAVELAKAALELLPNSTIEPERELSMKRLIFSTMQLSYSCLGEFQEALTVAYKIYEMLHLQAPDSLAYSEALANLATIERDVLGRYEVDRLLEALAIAKKRSRSFIPWILINIASMNIHLQKWDDAITILLQSKQLAQDMALEHWLVTSKYYLASVHFLKGELATAKEICQNLLANVENQDIRTFLATEIYTLAGRIENALNSQQKAIDFYRKALETAKVTKSIALINSVKIDIFNWHLSTESASASELYLDLHKEPARMYFGDQQRFKKLVDIYIRAGQSATI